MKNRSLCVKLIVIGVLALLIIFNMQKEMYALDGLISNSSAGNTTTTPSTPSTLSETPSNLITGNVPTTSTPTNSSLAPSVNTSNTNRNTTNRANNNVNTNRNTTMPKAGDASDYAIFVFIGIGIIVSIYAYKKIRDYNM